MPQELFIARFTGLAPASDLRGKMPRREALLRPNLGTGLVRILALSDRNVWCLARAVWSYQGMCLLPPLVCADSVASCLTDTRQNMSSGLREATAGASWAQKTRTGTVTIYVVGASPPSVPLRGRQERIYIHPLD
jgi:hypothetical protein